MPALGLLLLLGEACVAYAGMFHPHVDRYYREFYIDGYRSCWLTPDRVASAQAALLTDDITVAKLDAPAACYLLARGWSNMEDWGVWSDGGVVAIELPRVPGKTRLDLTLRAFSPRNKQMVTVFINGQQLGGYFVPSPGPSDLTLNIPASAAGDITILLRIKHPRRPPVLPGQDDTRHLGIGLISIKWQ